MIRSYIKNHLFKTVKFQVPDSLLLSSGQERSREMKKSRKMIKRLRTRSVSRARQQLADKELQIHVVRMNT